MCELIYSLIYISSPLQDITHLAGVLTSLMSKPKWGFPLASSLFSSLALSLRFSPTAAWWLTTPSQRFAASYRSIVAGREEGISVHLPTSFFISCAHTRKLISLSSFGQPELKQRIVIFTYLIKEIVGGFFLYQNLYSCRKEGYRDCQSHSYFSTLYSIHGTKIIIINRFVHSINAFSFTTLPWYIATTYIQQMSLIGHIIIQKICNSFRLQIIVTFIQVCHKSICLTLTKSLEMYINV